VSVGNVPELPLSWIIATIMTLHIVAQATFPTDRW
jgi:hypothetical protein